MSGRMQPPHDRAREVKDRAKGVCRNCGDQASLFAQETAGGLKGVWWCTRCNHVAFGGASWARLTDEQRATLPRLEANKEVCEVCKRVAVLERHHLAPRAQFGEKADDWPLVAVCHECHREWEQRMGTHPPATIDSPIPFGRYKGVSWREVAKRDSDYACWAAENLKNRGLRKLAQAALDEVVKERA